MVSETEKRIKDFKRIREKVYCLRITDLKDEELVAEIYELRIALEDIFKIINTKKHPLVIKK
jgi:hypothetical protein